MHQDILSNLPTLHVTEIELPREFEKLYEMAYNLWWAWTPEARDLFSAVDREKWARYRNPVQLLINVDPRHWYPLLEDESFQARYRSVSESFDAYLQREGGTFFDEAWPDFDRGHPIAYFSMEYGLHQCLAIYSGGLGVLSGDHCKSASDLGLPFVALGLLYRRGYFQQTIDAEGLQQHIYPEYDFTRLPLRPLCTRTGREILVDVPLPGRDVKVKLWLAQVGRVPLVLLDTDLPENDPADRPITNQLYVRGREMRLLQEIVLGVGGVRALDALGIEPGVWHLNEGHSAFLQTERVRRLVKQGESPSAALAQVARNAVFTTHTPVPAGNEQFDSSLIRKYFTSWCDEVGSSMEEFLALGRARDGESSFNLTALAIRTASWTNGVSRLNAQVTSEMWRHLFREKGDDSEQPIHPVTNGVHARTWLGPEMQELLSRYVGDNWERELTRPRNGEGAWDAVRRIPDHELWETHQVQKERLGRFARSRLRDQYARHGASPDELRSVSAMFDTRALTLGFARRFATYKRASLVFSHIERLQRILCSEDRPVQLIFAGKAHPADRPGQQLIQRIFELSRSDTFRGKVIVLENYDMRMGRMLVQGVDVWLNTPRRPMEASGTSGQKVAMNGGLNFSIADGWWPEGFDGHNGWVIGSHEDYDDEARQDHDDVSSLYDILERDIVPLYFSRGSDDLPHGWVERMKDAMTTLTASFSASRMVADYARLAYVPASRRNRTTV
ncbi:MAG: alpha-glucan family phosphorylase [Thermoanaerobaculia bacterium]|nr:alpha-glucan family phosphorylase [Thermoanaerobaculia bacterium]